MGYNVYNLRGGGSYGRKSSDLREFEEAMDMAKEGMERICSLAEEMVSQYGDRRGGSYGSRQGYDSRSGYGQRDWEDDDMMNERRMRDSRGRYR